MNPMTDGLPALRTYTGPKGEEKFLLLGIEMLTKAVCKGREIDKEDYRFCRKLISRAIALEEALDHRVDMQGSQS